MLNIRQDSKAQAFESMLPVALHFPPYVFLCATLYVGNVPSPNNTANALAIMQANSVTSQLHIDVGLGKLDFLVYNGPVAEFGIQLFCCHLALGNACCGVEECVIPLFLFVFRKNQTSQSTASRNLYKVFAARSSHN